MAAGNFDQSLAHVLRHEGGYVDHPADPGGPTKYGITLAVFRENGRPGATAADLRAITPAQAGAIYRARYWDALSCDALPAGLDYALFDYGVNSGVARAARVLRHLCGTAGQGAGLDAATLAAVRRRDAAALVASLCDERLAFLRRLKTWRVFGRGWSRRVAEVRVTALAMAAGAAAQREAAGTSTPAPGKGVAPINHSAERGTAGGAAICGFAAAQRAHDAGAAPVLILAILVAAALLVLGCALLWRWRAAREQARIVIPPQEGVSA